MWQRFCIIFSAFFLCSCSASMPIKPVQYSGDLEIYPAVVKVLTDRKSKIEKINVFNEEFCSDYIYEKDLLVDIRFKLVMKRKSNSIDVALSGMQHMNAKYKTWHNNDVTLVFNKNKYVNAISDEIFRVLNDPSTYEVAKSQTLSNLAFNHLVLKDMTEVGRQRWVKNNMSGRIYDLSLKLSNFEKNTSKGIDQNYVASFFYNTNDLYPEFSIKLYTDSDRYATLKTGALVETKGKLVDLSSNILRNDSFFLSLLEVQ